MTPIIEIQRAHFCIYNKKTNYETFIYIYEKPNTFEEARQFASHFYSQKSRHLTLRNFS